MDVQLIPLRGEIAEERIVDDVQIVRVNSRDDAGPLVVQLLQLGLRYAGMTDDGCALEFRLSRWLVCNGCQWRWRDRWELLRQSPLLPQCCRDCGEPFASQNALAYLWDDHLYYVPGNEQDTLAQSLDSHPGKPPVPGRVRIYMQSTPVTDEQCAEAGTPLRLYSEL